MLRTLTGLKMPRFKQHTFALRETIKHAMPEYAYEPEAYSRGSTQLDAAAYALPSRKYENDEVQLVLGDAQVTGTIIQRRVTCRQALSLCALTVQNTALVLTTKYSYRDGASPYMISTVVAIAEFAKLLLSYALLLTINGRSSCIQALREVPSASIQLAIPSVLYVIQNNLLFYSVKLLSPTLYMVCSQSKILSTAFWSSLLLQVKLSRKQHVALILLMFGMIMVESKETVSTGYGPPRTRRTVQGVICVFAATLISGYVGVYLERMYKGLGRTKKRSVWFYNVQLSLFSLPVAILAACVSRRQHYYHHNGLFQGFDGVVFAIVALQAFGGLAIAAVLRSAGNLLKCFAVSISICNCALLNFIFPVRDLHSFELSTLVGIALVISSTFLYSNLC